MQADPTFGPLEMDFNPNQPSESNEQAGQESPQFEMLGVVEDGNPQGFATADFRDRMVYVWSQVYIDAMIARERDGNDDGDYADGNQTDIRNYANWDANFNVTSLSVVGDYDFDGSFEAYPMAQRMTYDAYGNVQFVDLATWSITVINSFAWSFLHQGGKREGTGNYGFRRRDYSVSIGRFFQVDPLGYIDGSNLYQAYGSSPVNFADPLGLEKKIALGGGSVVSGEAQGGFGGEYGPLTTRAEARYGPITLWGGNVPIQGGSPLTDPPNWEGDWEWDPNEENDRNGRWRDKNTGKTYSWDPEYGHWDVDDGSGVRQRLDGRGNVLPDGHNPPPGVRKTLPPAYKPSKWKKWAGKGLKRALKVLPLVTAYWDYKEARAHDLTIVGSLLYTGFEQVNPVPVTLLDVSDLGEYLLTTGINDPGFENETPE